MRCSRCGAQIGNSYVRFNGALLCENCARDLKIDEVFRRQNSLFEQAFPMLGDMTGAFMGTGSDLEFSNTKLRCPRCGTSLRDIESNGQVGCIECYNTFNESILKNILKRQGNSDYKGRKPAQQIKLEQPEAPFAQEAQTAETAKPAAPEAKISEKKSETKVSFERYRNADLGMASDSELEEAMKQAAAAEEYDLAARLRDELMSRKGDN